MDSLRILARALRHAPMRRLQVASASWMAGEAAYLVGLFVFAYADGAGSVAIVAVIRTVPSIVLASPIATIAARYPVDSALRATLAVRVTMVLALGWVVSGDGPLWLAYLLAGIDSVAATLLRPLRATLLPAVSRSPEELIAGNVAVTTGDAIANLVGPGLAAVALLVGEPATTFVPALALFAAALVVSWGLRVARRDVVRRRRRQMAHPLDRPSSAARWLATSPVRFVIAGFTAQRFLRGGITVLLVAAAIDLLGMGDPGVGVLTAATGVGGLLGAGVALSSAGSRRLVPWFMLGIVVWGASIGSIGLIPLPVVAVTALALAGIGKVLLDVSGYTLLQRTVPTELRTRVFGIQEGLVAAAMAGGSIAASWLIGSIGIAPALVALGAVPLVVVAVLSWPLRQVDDAVVVPERDLHLLRANPLFEPLSMATLEEVAAGIGRRTVAAGAPIVHQGHPGDNYFAIEEGECRVVVDGQETARLGPGDSFGEIALLRNVPRTATVVAVSDVRLATIERSRFLDAVTGDTLSMAAAERTIEERLATDPG